MSSFSQTEWLIQGIIPKGNIILFLGTPNSGKSWMVETMVISLVTGARLFGEDGFDVKRSSVILLDEDTAGDVLLQRLEKLSPDFDSLVCNPRLHIHSVEGLILRKQELDTLISEIHSLPSPVIVFMDTLTTIMGHLDLNKTDAGYECSRVWNKIRDAGATLVMTHHLTEKASVTYQDMNFSRKALGSTLLNSKTDTIFGFFRIPPKNPARFVIRSTPRRVQQGLIDTIAIELVDRGKKTYPVLLDGIPEEPSVEAKEIFEYFWKGWEMTVKDIRKRSGNRFTESEIQQALRELERENAIIKGPNIENRFKYRLEPALRIKIQTATDFQISLLSYVPKEVDEKHNNGKLPSESKVSFSDLQ